MEPGATLRYTGTRPRRRSLESLIKQAALLSNSGTSNEDTTRHSGQDPDSNDDSDEEEPSSSSEESSASSSSDDDEAEVSISETSSSESGSAKSEFEIQKPAVNAPSFFENSDILEREFRSAFLPGLQSAERLPSAESSPTTKQHEQGATIGDVCEQLQSILSELSTINKKIDTSGSSGESSRAIERATALGVAAVDLGRSSVNHFSGKMRLTPTPEELRESHPRQLALLNKMRATIQYRDAPSFDKIHSIYSGHPSSTATTAPTAGTSEHPRYDTIDEYLYSSNAAPSGAFECKRCHRHFGSASTLSQHDKTCGANSPPSFSNADPATRIPCRHCGRLMTPNALAHHENICIRIFHGRRKHNITSANELAS